MKQNFRNFTLAEITEIIKKFGEKKFRAVQIYDWLNKKDCHGIDEMSNISVEMREKISEKYYAGLPVIIDKRVSKKDGTVKYLFKLKDGECIESVLLNAEDRQTICISTQVGCACGCTFCATATLGFKRNLEPGEITGQFAAVQRDSGITIDNVVFMGMGEPLLNWENLKKAIELLSDNKGRNLSQRRMTVSTVGIAPMIRELAKSNLKIGLAVSLITANDDMRSELMPFNKKYGIEKILSAVKYYNKKKGEMITFEYVLMEGVNDSNESAEKLLERLRGINYKVNLIPYNKVGGKNISTEPMAKAIKFQKILVDKGKKVFLRKEKGSDIDAACGQLALKQESRD